MLNEQNSILNKSWIGSICGGASIILTILGLSHIDPTAFMSVSIIVLSAGFFFRGAAITAEYTQLLADFFGASKDTLHLTVGFSFEILTGAAGMILGLLSLLEFHSNTLASAAVITLSVGTVMGSAAVNKLNALKLKLSGFYHSAPHQVVSEMLSAELGILMLASIAGLILGIISFQVDTPAPLNLIAILVLATSALCNDAALTRKILDLFHHKVE